MKPYFLIVLVSFFMSNCKSNNIENTATRFEPVTISKGDLFGDGKEGLVNKKLVIDNQDDFNSLIKKMSVVNDVTNNLKETEIDFSKFKVIAVFDKIQSVGGCSLDLNITNNPKNITVNVINKSPEGMAMTVITQPYCIVKIPKSNLPVVFE